MKRAYSFLLVAALAAFGLTACIPPKTPVYVCAAEAGPTPDTVAAATASGTDEPLAPETAGEEAKDEFANSDVRTEDGRVPIVTVEDGANGPEIVSTPVASEAEAEAVAEAAAADGDLTVVEADSVVTADVNPPDDLLFSSQYTFNLMAFVATWQFNAPNNFAGPRAGQGQVVAIIDTGVDNTHDDLDDGQVLAGAAFGQPNTPHVDPSGHGTRLAGIVAATTNNTYGIAGGAPAAKIFPIKVLNAAGSGLSSDVAKGILYAADFGGATVINLSLGGANPSDVQRAAIQHAVFDLGIPVIASAGNDGKCGQASYPAAFPEVLAVAAVDQAANWAGFSTTGPYVSVAAPGAAILSTCPPGMPAHKPACPSTGSSPGFNTQNGTSFSAPYVAAVAAIVRATNPGVVASGVYDRIIASAIDLHTPGWDPETGFGLVNPYGAAYCC